MTPGILLNLRRFLGRIPPEAKSYSVTLSPFGHGFGWELHHLGQLVRGGWSYGHRKGAEFDIALALRDLITQERAA